MFFNTFETVLIFKGPIIIYRTLRSLRIGGGSGIGFFEIPRPYPGKRGLKDLVLVSEKKARNSRKTIPERSRAQYLEGTKITNSGVFDFGISISGFSSRYLQKNFLPKSDFSHQIRYPKKLSLIKTFALPFMLIKFRSLVGREFF